MVVIFASRFDHQCILWNCTLYPNRLIFLCNSNANSILPKTRYYGLCCVFLFNFIFFALRTNAMSFLRQFLHGDRFNLTSDTNSIEKYTIWIIIKYYAVCCYCICKSLMQSDNNVAPAPAQCKIMKRQTFRYLSIYLRYM